MLKLFQPIKIRKIPLRNGDKRTKTLGRTGDFNSITQKVQLQYLAKKELKLLPKDCFNVFERENWIV